MENKRTTFEEFLKDKHAEYHIGTDDDMPDAFDNWLEYAGIDFIIDVADAFGKIEYLNGKTEGLKIAGEIFVETTKD